MKRATKKIVQPSAPVDCPFVLAIAGATQRFASEQIAFREGQRVQLEFTPSMVVVHDPAHPSPCSFTSLGIILYSYIQSGAAIEKARDTGEIVGYKMSFLLLEIRTVKNQQECKACGKRWPNGKRLEPWQIEDHMKGHK
jgi:hypothetical protein